MVCTIVGTRHVGLAIRGTTVDGIGL